MKKRLPAFAAGMLTMALIVGLGVSALAATGQLTLTVDPVNIQVNGSTFAPKDAKGNDVPVFAYNGTTYAPLRALAEAYGLTVGYDGAARMATVSSTPAAPDTPPADYSDWSAEDEAAYQEFKGMWEVEYGGLQTSLGQKRDLYRAYPKDTSNGAMETWGSLANDIQDKYSYRWMTALKKDCGVILTLCENKDAAAKYGFSIFETGEFWPGHS